jgi:ferredoxin
MPRIEVEGFGAFEAGEKTRLVRAIEGNGIDILHRCGGFARCTTCRVRFIEGEPERMTEAERNKLEEKGELGEVRLSCQILCDHDMKVHVVNRFHLTDLSDPGPEPEEEITPSPVWVQRPY